MAGREAGHRQTAGQSNPVPRGDQDPCKGGLVEIKPYRGFMCAAFLAMKPLTYELFADCIFAVELACPANE
jgi:hypothetical protein